MKQTVKEKVYTPIGANLFLVEVNKPDEVLTSYCSTEKEDCEEHSSSPLQAKTERLGELEN